MFDFARNWQRVNPVSLALLPASGLFYVLAALRRLLYRAGLLPSYRFPVPVIVVGNVVVGGAGKTPVVLELARMLHEEGYRPGIVSRGYRGSATGARQVFPDSDVEEVGDEALLLARSDAEAVWVGKDRVAAARALLEAHPRCDLIICDDGLQHYRLGRDMELIVEDERGHGNGWPLPAGPLREPPTRRADARIVNGAAAPLVAGGEPVFPMSLVFDAIEDIHRGQKSSDISTLNGKRVHAVAGIGNPDRFFRQLSMLGIKAVPHAFPDHHHFSTGDLVFPACDAIVMTEKDAVKCRRLNAPPGVVCYAMSVHAELGPTFRDFILQRLRDPALGRAPS